MRLDALTALQFGIARREQLTRAGYSPAMIRRRLASGEWQRVFAAVYATFSAPLDARRRQVAAWLYAGAGAQIAGPTAAVLHGLLTAPTGREVHLLVPHDRQVTSTGFAVIHRTVRIEERPCRFNPVTVCSAARAVVDTARWCRDPFAARSLVCEALARRVTTVDALRAETAAGRRNGSALLRRILDDCSSTPLSLVERDLRAALAASRELPPIVWDTCLVGLDGRRLPAVDGWIEDVGLAVEITDINATIPDERERAMRRHALLATYGAAVLQIPAARVRRDPAGVRLAVERAYRFRRAAGTRARATVSASVLR